MNEKSLQSRPLGAWLSKVRDRAGLTSAQAMQRLRRRLRQKVNRWGGSLIESWEQDVTDLEPWLLVEYLQAIGAPAETWLELLESLQIEPDTNAPRRSRGGLRSLLAETSEDHHSDLIAILGGWVRAEAEMVRVVHRMDRVGVHFIDFLLARLGPLRESDPEPGEEKPCLEATACTSL